MPPWSGNFSCPTGFDLTQPWTGNTGYSPCSLHATLEWENHLCTAQPRATALAGLSSNAPQPVCMQLQYGKFSASKAVCMQPLEANYGYFPCSLHATFGWEIAVAPKPVCMQPLHVNTSSAPMPVCMQPSKCISHASGNIRQCATHQPCNCNRQFTTKPVVPPCVPFDPMQCGCLSSAQAGTAHGVLMIDPMQAGCMHAMHARMASFHASATL
jgi:hypothetical protein